MFSNSQRPDFTAVKQHAEKETISPSTWVAITIPALALPLMTVAAVSVSMMESRLDAKAAELCNWQVNRAMDEGEPAFDQRLQHSKAAQPKAVDLWKTLGLPDWHNPFRPPPPALQRVESPAGSSDTASDDEKVTQDIGSKPKAGTGEANWRPPSTRPTPLSMAQSSDIEQLMHVGDQLSAAGRLEEAASAYSAALTKYPQHPQLRVAAIMADMRLRQYTDAKTLCLDGMNTASTYNDYVMFTKLLKNLPAN